nr:orotate phosphoribosyltransferase [Polycladospora coralii]
MCRNTVIGGDQVSQLWHVQDAIKRTKVLTEGHFILSSGKHSKHYMQCAQLFQYPKEAEAAGKAIADLFRDERIDLVVGPALGGVIVAHEVARALNVRCIFTERKEGSMQMRRGFTIKPNERILVVEDVVTTGGSVKEVLALLEAESSQIVGIGALVNRNGNQNPFAYPFKSLTAIEIESYEATDCPLCKMGIPAIKPGSRMNQESK